jgi:hypothetical protein
MKERHQEYLVYDIKNTFYTVELGHIKNTLYEHMKEGRQEYFVSTKYQVNMEI